MTKKSLLVERSEVPEGLKYPDYRPFLRQDFWFACAYCTTTEVEAKGVGMQIDHYVPVSVEESLEHEYCNLMYSCSPCNGRKSDIWPPPSAQRQGKRCLRPDRDDFREHLARDGDKLLGLTPEGTFSISILGLNREFLRQLRRIRQELYQSNEAIAFGLRALDSIQLDRLDAGQRLRIAEKRRELKRYVKDLRLTIDRELVCLLAASPALDEDPDDAKLRREALREERAVLPGVWRGREKPRKANRRKRRKR